MTPAPDTEDPLDSALGWVAHHTRRYVETDGEEGHDWNGVPCLVLTTRGRRSGRLRRNALIYGRDNRGHFVVVASYGGSDQHPRWYTNLVADPHVIVQVGPKVMRAIARTAKAKDKPELWHVMTRIWPDYDAYQAKTKREIPVVVLTPAAR